MKQRCATINSSAEAANIVIGTTEKDETDTAVSKVGMQSDTTLKANKSTTTYGKRKRTDTHTDAKRTSDQGQCSMASDTREATNLNTPSGLMGVKLVWVHPTKRRQAIASRLLDTARRCFVYGTIVPVDGTAFSQPTEAGFAFASRYCQRGQVLAYA